MNGTKALPLEIANHHLYGVTESFPDRIHDLDPIPANMTFTGEHNFLKVRIGKQAVLQSDILAIVTITAIGKPFFYHMPLIPFTFVALAYTLWLPLCQLQVLCSAHV
jgi:hypothetical protein